MPEEFDPLDVTALEAAVNNSAVRTSTIWVSYIAFGLYLIMAAGNVTQRQLLLDEPMKLPVLSIDLPLVAFFLITPVLFVIFHLYVLLQVMLLARTAKTYNEAVGARVRVGADRARVRQRLANTLFAQLFSGAPTEREGLMGYLLYTMALTTLAIAPVLVLVTFQIKFLPYHSWPVTWSHRIVLLIDLMTILVLWPYIRSTHDGVASHRLRDNWVGFMFSSSVILFSLFALSFPGEVLSALTRYSDLPDARYWSTPLCQRKSIIYNVMPANFDRLVLPGGHFVNEDEAAKIEKAAKTIGEPLWTATRTRSFRYRDLRCSRLGGADLSFSDFEGVVASDANFVSANLRGAYFFDANLQESFFAHAHMEGVNFNHANLENSNLSSGYLDDAQFYSALICGTVFKSTNISSEKLSEQLKGAISHDCANQKVSHLMK